MAANKVALVTGSTNGLGIVIADVFASKGCNLIITGLGEPEKIEQIKTQLESKYQGIKVDYVSGDLSQAEDIASMCEKIKSLYPEGVDILVNNAATGMWDACPVEKFPLEKWQAILAVNLTAPMLLTQQFLPGMKKKGWGRIVNIGSIEGLRGTSKMLSAYSSSKHGLVGLTKCVALECASSGVTCNVICPMVIIGTAVVDTWYKKLVAQRGEDYGKSVSQEQYEMKLSQMIPTQQMIKPEQVADLVAFLSLSVASDNITGATYEIDGGRTADM